MPVTFVAAGAVDTGTTVLLVPYPAGILAGDLLVLAMESKYAAAFVPPAIWSGEIEGSWAYGGVDSSNFDRGLVRTSILYKIADGTETGTLSVSVTAALNTVYLASIGRMFLYRKDPLLYWSVAFASGTQNVAGSTAWSVTGSADPDVVPGDVLLVASGNASDLPTFANQLVSAPGVSAWGATVVRNESGTSGGLNSRLIVTEHVVSAGASSGPPTYSMTASAFTTWSPAGSTVFARIRESAVDPASGQFSTFYVETWTTSILSHGQVKEFYVEEWTEGPWAPADPMGRVTEVYTEVWAETPVVSGQVLEVYIEQWTEGPWAPNSPYGRVDNLYVEVWAEGPSSTFPTQYGNFQVMDNDGVTVCVLCLVAEADRAPGLLGAPSFWSGTTELVAYLVDTTDPNASPLHVWTNAGLKAVRRKT